MEPTTLHFPINLTIDQTETGYRAILPSSPPEEIEAPTIPELLGILEEKLALIEAAVEDAYDRKTTARAMEDIRANGSVPWEQLKFELGL